MALADSAPGEPIGAPLRGRSDACPTPTTLWQRARRALYARSPLLRSSAFRMAISFWLLLVACNGAAGYFFYERLQESAMDRVDSTIQDRLEIVRTVFELGGLDGVIETALSREDRPMHFDVGFNLSAPNGARLVGNLPQAVQADGWSTMSGAEVGLPGDANYRFFTTDLGEYRLTLGRSLNMIDQMRDVAINCLLWAFAVSIALALLAAWWLMRRSSQRMLGFGVALNRVADGHLTARVPVSSANDDIDTMALTVNAALERLNGNVDSLRQVSTDIAHDLKTPLNRLYILLDEAAGHAQRLERDAGAPIAQALDDALGEAEHINATFEALLRVAQIEAGSRRAHFAHFDLAETLATACEIYAPVVEDSCAGLDLRFDIARALPMYGDRELVLQLIVNLIENAIRHGCGEQRPDVRIAIEAGERGGEVWLTVIDSGPGIPDAMHEKVFQRLFRLERSRTTSGTGLGLSLVKAIADLHCGSIELADNQPGLRFTVRFDRDCPLEQARR